MPTTSGTYTFAATLTQIITSALRKIGVLAEGDTPNPDQQNNALFVLQTVLDEAEADGMPLWAVVEQLIPCSSFTNGKYTFPSDGTAPLKVLSAYNRNNVVSTQPIDIPMTVLTHNDYNWLSNKLTQGTAVQFYYEPLNQGGNLFIWPIPDSYSNSYRSINITYQRPFQDVGSVVTDNIDFPPYWTNAIIYALASRLAPEYGSPPNDRQLLIQEARAYWEHALEFGTEEGSVYVEPDWSRMYQGRGNT